LYTESVTYNQQNAVIVAHLTQTIVQCNQTSDANKTIIRILEIGAGSASTTVQCINALRKLNLAYHYTFTDISNSFINEAKKILGEGPEMNYALFNIEKDPLAQGFCPNQFDVIIGNQVVHATIDIHESLRNLKKVFKSFKDSQPNFINKLSTISCQRHFI